MSYLNNLQWHDIVLMVGIAYVAIGVVSLYLKQLIQSAIMELELPGLSK